MYHGDIRLSETIDIQFCTVQASGAPTTLAGSPVISAYVGNGTTQITAGITLTVDHDGVTGHHNVRVVASSGNGFATATNVALVITTGTVNSVSAVGYVIGSFSIENREANMTRLNGVAASAANLEKSASVIYRGSITSTSTTTGLIDSALTQSATDFWKGRIVIFTSGALLNQATDVTAFTPGTDTLTVTALTAAPANADTFVIV